MSVAVSPRGVRARRSTFVTLLLVASLALAPDAGAGTIGFKITASVTTGPGVRVVIELANTGDEAAIDVTPIALLGDRSARSPAVREIAANASHRFELEVQKEDLPPGSYVLVNRVQYEDSNGYPFEVLAATPFDVSTTRRRPVIGTITAPTLGGSGSVEGRAVFRAPSDRGRRYEVTFLSPRGIRMSPERHELEATADGSLEVPFSVQNVSLLTGNSAAVFALVRSLDETPPQTDLIRGNVRALAVADRLETRDFFAVIGLLLVTLVALELYSRVRSRGKEPRSDGTIVGVAVGILLAVASSAFLIAHYPWKELLAPTITAGGDMASLYYPTRLMAEEMLPRGQITGWTMGNYAGFPVLHFYSTLPFAVIALLGHVVPMQVAFKLVTLLGPTTLPIAAAYLFRRLGYRPAAAAIAAAATLSFLLQQGNSMWGGNIPSVLAGEFCHALGLSLSLVFLGYLHGVVAGTRSWPFAALLLAVIGLCHTFAFFTAAWYTLFYLLPSRTVTRQAPPVLVVYFVAFLLLCFWGLPLPTRLVYTTEWSMIWHIKDWKEVLPQALWPPAALAALNCLAMLTTVKRFEFERAGLLLFNIAGGILLYFVVPALGFPDIRFIPVAQLFTCLLAADFLAWVGSRLRYPLVYAACVVAVALSWGHEHIGYIPSWLKWNYSGYEGKPTWPLFKTINEHIAGDVNDPRVMFEHSEAHNRFGSSRAFENLPLFSGRSTLEGVFHQASQSSPFIFYLQSEASERASGPFPQYTYTRLNPARAVPHMRLFNVSHIVTVSEKAKAAYSENLDFERTFASGAYAVFALRESDPRYVVPATNQPVLYEGDDWKLAFYRWYKHPELLDIPLVPSALIPRDAARDFALRTETITRLPKVPLEGACDVKSRLENYRITFDTTCPDRPHIVKVSYFPRWSAGDTARLLPVSPGFMLVYPRAGHVEITYERTLLDQAGVGLSITGLALLLVAAVSRRSRDAMTVGMATTTGPLLRVLERHYVLASTVVVLLLVGIGAYTRWSLRQPERAYQEAQDAYRTRDFPEAIRRLEAWTSIDRDTFKQATALHQLGVSYGEVGQHASAVEVLERLRFQFPNVDYGAATLFHLAKSWRALDAIERAREYAVLLAVDFADSSLNKRLQREEPSLFAPEQAVPSAGVQQ
jgi:hypothetical protein